MCAYIINWYFRYSTHSDTATTSVLTTTLLKTTGVPGHNALCVLSCEAPQPHYKLTLCPHVCRCNNNQRYYHALDDDNKQCDYHALDDDNNYRSTDDLCSHEHRNLCAYIIYCYFRYSAHADTTTTSTLTTTPSTTTTTATGQKHMRAVSCEAPQARLRFRYTPDIVARVCSYGDNKQCDNHAHRESRSIAFGVLYAAKNITHLRVCCSM